jgi:hypothetical protein
MFLKPVLTVASFSMLINTDGRGAMRKRQQAHLTRPNLSSVLRPEDINSSIKIFFVSPFISMLKKPVFLDSLLERKQISL